MTPSGVVIGSAARCAIRDADHSVQPQHCRVFRDNSEGWLIEDLNSAGGTFINGRRVVGVERIVDGDVIRCASSSIELVFELGESAPAPVVRGFDDEREALRADLIRRSKAIGELEAELASTRDALELCRGRGEELADKLALAREHEERALSDVRHELAELRRTYDAVVHALAAAEQRASSNDTLIAELREVIDHLQRRRDGVEV